jgi:hypothetical protein
MMAVPGIQGSTPESLPTTSSKPTETEMNPLREIASVMMVRVLCLFLKSPLNLKKTTSSSAPPVFYVAKNWYPKYRKKMFPINSFYSHALQISLKISSNILISKYLKSTIKLGYICGPRTNCCEGENSSRGCEKYFLQAFHRKRFIKFQQY